ncbi:unnamed protein product [Amoebophrya sp. A25]|nr:unnamed protein product [Amoebophrya sp. A25]|eukprot:GSA25T00004373001.1
MKGSSRLLQPLWRETRGGLCHNFRSFSSSAAPKPPGNVSRQPDGSFRTILYDGEEEVLTAAQYEEKQRLIKELTRRLSGPLADENGNVPTGKDRPIAIEVDGPSHFYANSQRYTAYSKLKHRLLTRMGYKVLHVPYFDWRRLRGAREREEYMRNKLKEEPTEWLDPDDAKYYDRFRNGQSAAVMNTASTGQAGTSTPSAATTATTSFGSTASATAQAI